MSFINKILLGVIITGSIFILNQFFYLIPVHVGAFIVTITLVVIADLHALLWVMGRMQTLPHQRMSILHNLISAGLFISIVSGAFLFYPLREFLITSVPFLVKMLFVGALVVNSFVIARHMHLASTRPFSSLEKDERLPLFLSGFVSVASWVGAFLSAQFLGV